MGAGSDPQGDWGVVLFAALVSAVVVMLIGGGDTFNQFGTWFRQVMK